MESTTLNAFSLYDIYLSTFSNRAEVSNCFLSHQAFLDVFHVLMALHTRFLILLLQIALVLHFAHAASTVVNYAQPLPCFGFCLALDPGLIRRYDGVSPTCCDEPEQSPFATILFFIEPKLNNFATRFTFDTTRMEAYIFRSPWAVVLQVLQGLGSTRGQLCQIGVSWTHLWLTYG